MLGILNIGASDNDPAADTIRAGGRKLNNAAAVLSRTTDAPAITPTLGDIYIVPASATGDFAGQDDDVAYYDGAAWEFYTPVEGWRCWVADDTEMVVWTGGAWDNSAIGGGGGGGDEFALGADITGTTYNVTNADLGGGVYKDTTNSSAVTITVPSGLTGTKPFSVEQNGTGQITFAAGSGVTINVDGGGLKSANQYTVLTLVPKGSDVYTLIGNTVA